MKKEHLLPLSALLASLMAGCGGGSGGGTPATAAPPAPPAPAQPAPPAQPPAPAPSEPAPPAQPAPAQGSWTNVKFGGGGYVPGLVFHPTSPDVLYARTDMGGAYRWNATTSAWVPITDGFGAADTFHHGSETMALDPNDDKRVYMGTGMYLSDKADARLYISTDRGDNWTYVNLPFSAASNAQGRAVGERLMVDPNNPAILFYGTRTTGLWKSADRGQTWQQVASLSTHKMSQAQIDAVFWKGVVGVEQVIFDTSTKGTGSATQTIYTAVAPDYAAVAGLTHNMYKTTNGGASWTGIAVPASVKGYHIPHMVRAKDGMMYVAFTQGTGPGAPGSAALYKFDGSNWTLLKSYTSSAVGTGYGMGGLSVSGSGAATRIALGVTNSWGNYEGQPVVQLSDNAGATWREISALAPHEGHKDGWSGWIDDVEIDPNNAERVLHVHGGGVWETRNASAAKPTWTNLTAGLEETATLQLTTPPPGATYKILNSSGDIGIHVHTDLAAPPVHGPKGYFVNGNSADVAWSDSAYIAAIGVSMWDRANVGGVYSTDSGVTWTAFPANHPDGLKNQSVESNLVVTKPGHIVWAPSRSVPAYTTNHGASWTYTNLPALVDNSYRLAADRGNPNRVYAYDSGGGWWRQAPKFYYSTDGGKTFTVSSQFAAVGARPEFFQNASLAVNPNAEGDVWLADAHSIFHSTDGGATWNKLGVTGSIWGSHPTTEWPEVYGATALALGKAVPGASYSASLYLVGVINGVWGLHRSDDAGVSWKRINDDKHQFGGIGVIAADQNIAGRVYISGSGRGILFNN